MKKITYLLFIGGMILSVACTGNKAEKEMMNEQPEEVRERVRPAASGGTSAAYFVYTNLLTKADTLLSVEADFAEMVQVHESYETEGGMMGMREQKEVIVQPAGEIRFKQGGLHIMLMGLNQELKDGDSVAVRLEFAAAGEVVKKLPVQP
ncbi:copper chaperone PCu(A)C [Gracilimonas sp. BCB1]|uniref:copper chaperone PCu(A)C n=1 Tax=Gracilimonas sp. BCB1 TaxID=3152362 RepID=UPI0032D8C96D